MYQKFGVARSNRNKLKRRIKILKLWMTFANNGIKSDPSFNNFTSIKVIKVQSK